MTKLFNKPQLYLFYFIQRVLHNFSIDIALKFLHFFNKICKNLCAEEGFSYKKIATSDFLKRAMKKFFPSENIPESRLLKDICAHTMRKLLKKRRA